MVLKEMGSSLTDPLVKTWYEFVDVIPGLIAAIVVLIVGYLLGIIIGYIVKKVLDKIELNKWVIEKTKLSKMAGKFKLSDFFGLITKWYIFILFLTPAASLIKLKGLSALLQSLAVWIPSLIVAVVVAMIGFIAAEYVAVKIKDTKIKYAQIIADGISAIIIVFVALIALRQMGINVFIIENSLLIILAGIMLAIALALGIGFGLGLKDESKDIIKRMKKKL